MKSDSEPAMKSGSRMIIEKGLVGSSKRATGSLGERFNVCREWSKRGAARMKQTWEVKIVVTHFVWPWIAERAGVLFTGFEVGRDGTNGVRATEREISEGTRFVIRILWKRRRAGGPPNQELAERGLAKRGHLPRWVERETQWSSWTTTRLLMRTEKRHQGQ